MVEITWKEPPPTVSAKYAPVLGELKKNPGRWALVNESASSSGAGQPWKKLGCEASVHRANPGEDKARYDVYARWPETTAPAAGKAALADDKATVANAVATGTALKPPPAPPKAPQPEVRAANDMGLQSYLKERRARGAVDRPE